MKIERILATSTDLSCDELNDRELPCLDAPEFLLTIGLKKILLCLNHATAYVTPEPEQ